MIKILDAAEKLKPWWSLRTSPLFACLKMNRLKFSAVFVSYKVLSLIVAATIMVGCSENIKEKDVANINHIYSWCMMVYSDTGIWPNNLSGYEKLMGELPQGVFYSVVSAPKEKHAVVYLVRGDSFYLRSSCGDFHGKLEELESVLLRLRKQGKFESLVLRTEL